MYERTSTLINELGIKLPSVYVPISVLSGGQRQAVAVARAVLQEGKVILMDEPTAALGVREKNQVLDIIKQLRDRGKSIILISHDLDVVFNISNKIQVLRLWQVQGIRKTNDTNVFIRKCKVKGESHGLLSGKTIGLKDNIRLAGVPMTNGSRLAPGYVPVLDATVVERILEAGGTIIGKLNMDSFGMGGTSETSDFGVPLNPHNREFSTGGSSGGSAAAVAASEVNISLGVDEGGSARIPASWCGVISIKPTHGLVPSFGITYLDHTIDYICPTASTVEDTAITLEVIAGEDKKVALVILIGRKLLEKLEGPEATDSQPY